METKVPQGSAALPDRTLRSDCTEQVCPAAGCNANLRSANFGCAGNDLRICVCEIIAGSVNKSRLLFFTIVRADMEPVLSSEKETPAAGADEGPVACSERRYSQPPTGSSGEHSVCQFFRDGTYEYVRRYVGPKEAIDAATTYSSNVSAAIGMTRRVIITDADDCLNWEWRFGEGVVFPPPTTVPSSAE